MRASAQGGPGDTRPSLRKTGALRVMEGHHLATPSHAFEPNVTHAQQPVTKDYPQETLGKWPKHSTRRIRTSLCGAQLVAVTATPSPRDDCVFPVRVAMSLAGRMCLIGLLGATGAPQWREVTSSRDAGRGAQGTSLSPARGWQCMGGRGRARALAPIASARGGAGRRL